MQAICVTCVEFVNMMVQAGRLQDAALMLGHLDKTGGGAAHDRGRPDRTGP